MPDFTYKALTAQGKVDQGSLAARDRSEAMALLTRQGLQPVSLKVGGVDSTTRTKEALPTGSTKLSKQQIIFFTEELSDFLGAGLQLEPALQIMENRQEFSSLKTVAQRVRQLLRDGKSFSASLRQASPSFDQLYCNLAAAGEVSGALPQILKRHGEYLKTMQELRNKTLSALLYPLFLMGAAVAVIFIFVRVLLPQLEEMMADSRTSLHPILQNLIELIRFGNEYWYFFAVGAFALILTFWMLVTRPSLRPGWDRIKLRLPVVGPLLSTRFYVQFTEMLANLLGNGLTLLKGLEMTRSTTTNLYLHQLLGKVIELVGDGASLSRALKRVGYFPALLRDMITVGEQTGKLAPSLQKAASRYDKQMTGQIQKMTTLMPLVFIVLLTFIVGTMAMVMMSIIFQTMSGLAPG